MSRIIIIGPAYPLRGGLASFNERMARAFTEEGHEVKIYTFSLQYPSFLFPGKTQYSQSLPPEDLDISRVINSVNPVNWVRTGNQIARENADLIIVRYWIPFMAPALGTILRVCRSSSKAKIIALVDNAIPHEKRVADTLLSRYFVGAADAFVTMSEKVKNDLQIFTQKNIRVVHHPLYDHFGQKKEKSLARNELQIENNSYVYLFFGFIRHYKGLDLLIRAFEQLLKESKTTITLLIAGEFYSDEEEIKQLIAKSPAKDFILLHDHFITDEEISRYFSAADCVVQPYRNATQSGVTPLAYHFETPMIVTNVGALPDMVPSRIGLVCQPDPESICNAMKEIQSFDLQTFREQIVLEKKKYGWPSFVHSFLSMLVKTKANG